MQIIPAKKLQRLVFKRKAIEDEDETQTVEDLHFAETTFRRIHSQLPEFKEAIFQAEMFVLFSKTSFETDWAFV